MPAKPGGNTILPEAIEQEFGPQARTILPFEREETENGIIRETPRPL